MKGSLLTTRKVQQALKQLLTPHTLTLLALGGVAFTLALWVIYVKDEYRQHFIQLETLKSQHSDLETEWSELLLEESTWSSRTRVSELAQAKLGLVPIQASNIRMLSEAQIQQDKNQ